MLMHSHFLWGMYPNFKKSGGEKKFWEKMFHMANNDNVLFVRKETEKLIKAKK